MNETGATPRRWRSVALGVKAVQACAMGLVGLAGLAKFADVPAFQQSLTTWTLIPLRLHAVIALAVPCIELGASLAYFLRLSPQRAAAAAATLVALFTAVLGVHLATGGEPECSCFGVILAHREQASADRWTIVRNVLLISAVLAPILVRPRAKQTSTLGPARARSSGGFTLLETLLTVALVGILTTMVFVELRVAREHAQRVQSLSNMRQHVAVFGSYAAANRDRFPWYTRPDATYSVIRGGNVVLGVSYFGGHYAWNVALADLYYDGDPRHPSFFPPYFDDPIHGNFQTRLLTPYYYGHCFITAPSFWRYETRRADRSQWRQTSQAEVLFPSSKGLFIDNWSFAGSSMGPFPHGGVAPPAPHPVLIAFVDGSARAIRRDTLVPPYQIGLSDPDLYSRVLPVMHTLEGVEGRDVP